MPHKTFTKDSAWLVYLTSLTEKGAFFKQVILYWSAETYRGLVRDRDGYEAVLGFLP